MATRVDRASQRSVLVVEDDSTMREVLCELLRDEGYRTRAASTMAQARKRLAEETPSVLMLDLELPDGSAVELLRELGDRTSAPPTMLLTGDLEARSTARRFGIPVVTKPRIRGLLTTVARTADERPRPRRHSRPSRL